MEKIILPKIKEDKVSDNLSTFIIEPLYPGFGATLGNAIRRVILSSLPGSAITSFEIEGVSHEFTSLPHVKEDLIEIMLNLKTVKFLSHGDEPITLTINKKGPGIVKASDFSKNSQVEILNSDQLIATLDEKAKFELEAVIEKNRGFKSTDDENLSNNKIGVISIDASFSPIERVKILVSNTRVGQMTNFDKLEIEVETDGSITPKDAMIQASNILIDHYKSFAFNIESEDKLTEEAKEEVEKEEEIAEEKFQILDDETAKIKVKIEEAGLSPRTTNALLNAGIKTVSGLKRMSDLKISEIKGLGQKGIIEIKNLTSE